MATYVGLPLPARESISYSDRCSAVVLHSAAQRKYSNKYG